WNSSTSGRGPTRRAPTARPNASSRPPCANGPTRPASRPRSSAKRRWTTGSTTLQLASASHRCRWPGPDLKTGVQPKQPIEAPQLGRRQGEQALGVGRGGGGDCRGILVAQGG